MKTIQISDELHQRIKIACANRNMKITSIVNEALELILMKYEEANYTYISKDGRVIKEFFPKND